MVLSNFGPLEELHPNVNCTYILSVCLVNACPRVRCDSSCVGVGSAPSFRLFFVGNLRARFSPICTFGCFLFSFMSFSRQLMSQRSCRVSLNFSDGLSLRFSERLLPLTHTMWLRSLPDSLDTRT